MSCLLQDKSGEIPGHPPQTPFYAHTDTITITPWSQSSPSSSHIPHSDSGHVDPKRPPNLISKPDVNTFTHNAHYFFFPSIFLRLPHSPFLFSDPPLFRSPVLVSAVTNQEMGWKSQQGKRFVGEGISIIFSPLVLKSGVATPVRWRFYGCGMKKNRDIVMVVTGVIIL
ncbi:hypothetical protein CEXT_89021 [Caerostris extrusa]|uniref:Uncharacterized protein n=1 Tax=Caerostris extrusa TaxID=172846 RepID=A0AAV4T0T2_CAEEX|nr:hypothetical protein CEXT_89021 [Caerostris extrusa]